MTQQENKARRQTKTIYTVQCSDPKTNAHRRWHFSNQAAAETAIKRLSAHPTATCSVIIKEELWSNAPTADTVSATMSLNGTVLETAGPFPNLDGNDTARLVYDHHSDGQLLYTKPGTSKRQANEGARQMWEFLTERSLLPASHEQARTLMDQYRGLPWWLETPPTIPEPGHGTALHGLLICPDCSRFLDEAKASGKDVYNCPGDEPTCRCKNVPAEQGMGRIIQSLKLRVLEDHQMLDAAREIQGWTTDGHYHRSLAQEALDIDERNQQHLIKIAKSQYLRELIGQEPEERAAVRAAMQASTKTGSDPLSALESIRETGGCHHQFFSNQYVYTLLKRPDSARAADWMRQHIRLAEVVQDAERIHYRQPSGKEQIMWENADDESFTKRVKTKE